MGIKGEQTREAILDKAQDLILKYGFSGTSIDAIISEAGITKGGFFYHFNGRNELAKALLVRYLEADDRIIRNAVTKAKNYVDDPYQQLIVFLRMYIEVAENMEEVHPGCLVATYTYESQQFNPDILELIKTGVDSWKKHFMSMLEPAVKSRKLRPPFTAEFLANMLNAIVEGGIILTKINRSNSILVEQMKGYVEVVKLAFDDRT